MKSIEMHLKVTRRGSREVHTSEYEAELRMDDDTIVGDLVQFAKDCKKIWNKAIEAAKDADNIYSIEMDVTSATYKGWRDPVTPLEQTGYNRWAIRDITDICTGKGEESVYLAPDTRYTSDWWDLLIQRDVMAGLATI